MGRGRGLDEGGLQCPRAGPGVAWKVIPVNCGALSTVLE